MFEIAKHSLGLMARGKLFAEPAKVYRQAALGAIATALLLIALAVLGAPLWAAALIAGFTGGALQPYLFRNLRYR